MFNLCMDYYIHNSDQCVELVDVCERVFCDFQFCFIAGFILFNSSLSGSSSHLLIHYACVFFISHSTRYWFVTPIEKETKEGRGRERESY